MRKKIVKIVLLIIVFLAAAIFVITRNDFVGEKNTGKDIPSEKTEETIDSKEESTSLSAKEESYNVISDEYIKDELFTYSFLLFWMRDNGSKLSTEVRKEILYRYEKIHEEKLDEHDFLYLSGDEEELQKYYDKIAAENSQNVPDEENYDRNRRLQGTFYRVIDGQMHMLSFSIADGTPYWYIIFKDDDLISILMDPDPEIVKKKKGQYSLNGTEGHIQYYYQIHKFAWAKHEDATAGIYIDGEFWQYDPEIYLTNYFGYSR